jgi:hypothetical protein
MLRTCYGTVNCVLNPPARPFEILRFAQTQEGGGAGDTPSEPVGDLAVLGDVEAGDLLFFLHPQAD